MPFIKIMLTALALAAAQAAPAWAELADRSKPMNVEADALRHDDARQTSSFTGRVVVTKGSIVMRGTKLDVRQEPDGAQFGLLTAETGQRAFFRQKREGVDEYIEAEAERIDYDGRQDVITLSGSAEVRRLQGASVQDQINGKVIVYNNLTSVFTVDGAAPTGSGPGPGGTRVRAMFGPRAPAAQPAQPATLKPSTTLSGEPSLE